MLRTYIVVWDRATELLSDFDQLWRGSRLRASTQPQTQTLFDRYYPAVG